MPSVRSELDALIKVQLDSITGTLKRLENAIADLNDKVDSVRVAELSAIRANLADTAAKLTAAQAAQEAEIKLLRYQMGRSNAMWGLIITPITSAIVAALMAIMMRR